MHSNSTPTQQQAPIIWILVADGARAQIYRYHNNESAKPMHEPQFHSTNQNITHHALTPVVDMSFTAESVDDFQVSHDGRGSLIGGQNAAHNSCEPHLDIHEEVKQNLVMAIVAKLKQACQDNAFEQLAIVASPQTLGLLRRHLPIDVTARVIAEIPKDLTHVSTEILLTHLQEALSKPHAA